MLESSLFFPPECPPPFQWACSCNPNPSSHFYYDCPFYSMPFLSIPLPSLSLRGSFFSFIIVAHLWFISLGMDANSSLGACFKESRMSVAGPNLCLQTTQNVCREAPFVFRAKQSSQWGASSSHLNSDSVSCFFFWLILLLFLAPSVFPFSIQS